MTCPHFATAITLAMATEQDMDAILRIRHQFCATELDQHPEKKDGRLTDSLDAFNSYVVAKTGEDVAGFISITSPNSPFYSVDKYFSHDEIPVPFDDGLYELCILTVVETYRGGPIAAALMYAGLRWIEECGGRNIIAVGSVELLDFYLKVGMHPMGRQVQSGVLTFELLTGSVANCAERLRHYTT